VQPWFGALYHNIPSFSTWTLSSHTSNVPGVALYFTSLTYLRSIMTKSPYFSAHQRHNLDSSKSVLPKLSSQGNLIAGATARVGVGFILNPFSVLKARFEVSTGLSAAMFPVVLMLRRVSCMHTIVYPALWFPSPVWESLNFSGGLLHRHCGMRHMPVCSSSCTRVSNARQVGSSLVTHELDSFFAAYFLPNAYSTGIHSFAAASAGAIATMATHPFDVIKAISSCSVSSKISDDFIRRKCRFVQRISIVALPPQS